MNIRIGRSARSPPTRPSHCSEMVPAIALDDGNTKSYLNSVEHLGQYPRIGGHPTFAWPILRRRRIQQPFLLYLAHCPDPTQARETTIEKRRAKRQANLGTKQDNPIYAATVERADSPASRLRGASIAPSEGC